jgi:D-tyrosyl-tRNA(Tyr) deacylase
VQELYGKDKVKDGIFQAMMDVQLVNDGPVSDNESLDPIGITYICEDEAVSLSPMDDSVLICVG